MRSAKAGRPLKGIKWVGKIEKAEQETVHTCDPPEKIAICLECPVPGKCRPSSPECPLQYAKRGRPGRFKMR